MVGSICKSCTISAWSETAKLSVIDGESDEMASAAIHVFIFQLRLAAGVVVLLDSTSFQSLLSLSSANSLQTSALCGHFYRQFMTMAQFTFWLSRSLTPKFNMKAHSKAQIKQFC